MSRTVDLATTSLIARMAARFQAWLRYRQEMAELDAMGPRELADLGLTRADVVALRKGVYHDTREDMPVVRAAYRAANTNAQADAPVIAAAQTRRAA